MSNTPLTDAEHEKNNGALLRCAYRHMHEHAERLEVKLAEARKANAILYGHADSMMKGIEAVVRSIGQVSDSDLSILAKDRAEIDAARLLSP